MSSITHPARPSPVSAYLGFGANQGEPETMLRHVLHALNQTPGISVTACASLYQSKAIDTTEAQPDYLNTVIAITTVLSSHQLLARLMEIESAAGRTRLYHHAPRTLDLDLLLYEDQIIHDDILTVPHPRMHQRAFVLLPLLEIAPDIIIPGRGTAGQFLPHTRDQSIFLYSSATKQTCLPMPVIL